MSKTFITLEANRQAYSLKDLGRTMTVADMVEYLSQFAEDTPVVISNDNGYTYGAITPYSFNELGAEEEE